MATLTITRENNNGQNTVLLEKQFDNGDNALTYMCDNCLTAYIEKDLVSSGFNVDNLDLCFSADIIINNEEIEFSDLHHFNDTVNTVDFDAIEYESDYNYTYRIE